MKKVKWLIMFFVVLTLLLPAGDLADAQKKLAQIQRDIQTYHLDWKANLNTKFIEYCRTGQAKFLGGLKPRSDVMITPLFSKPAVLPSYFDWRNYNGKNYITPIKDQGGCGSCWAFCAVGTIEAMWKIEKDRPDLNPDLSEQDLVSCCTACWPESGCNGGWYDEAANYIRTTGIIPEYCFSYFASDLPCNTCDEGPFVKTKITESHFVTGEPADFNALCEALTHGPIMVGFTVFDDFFAYSGGVYSPTPGSSVAGGHAVVMVGYDDALDCWIVKNSWGADWGESGYFRIKRGTACDIETWAMAASGVDVIKIAGY